MSNINWSKDGGRRRMQRQGIEDRAGLSKDALRRQADALLAGYTGPATKVPAGARVTADFRSERTSGNVARSVTVRSDSEATFRSKRTVEATTPKGRKSKGYRAQTDLFGTSSGRANRNDGKPRYWGKSANRNNDLHARIDTAVPPGLVLYADGACEPNPGAGGWGFVVYRDGVEIHADCGGSNPTTNNIMELTGALMALQWIAGHLVEKQDSVRLFCDSQYVVSGANSWRHGWKRNGWQRGGPKAKPENRTIANLDLWKELDAALTAVPIQLEWVKGHAGIIGNERADELSLEGRDSILALEKYSTDDLIREQLDYSARGGV